MSRPNYYHVLGVKRGATTDEIKKAFHGLAKRYHPDRHRGNAEFEKKFQQITEAYEVLSDPGKRGKYDQLSQYDSFGFDLGSLADLDLTRIFKGKGGGLGALGDLGGLGGLYDRFFGAGRKPAPGTAPPGAPPGADGGAASPAAPARGEDLHFTISVSLDTVARGDKAVLVVPREAGCRACSGSGLAPGGRKLSCDKCRGTGQLTLSQGTFGVNRPCDGCLGRGIKIQGACAACRGDGSITSEEKIAVRVPRGIEDGTELRLRGQGKPGRAGPPGDLMVKVSVEENPQFKRSGSDLYHRARVNVFQALLGTEIAVPTLDGGDVKVAIPAGTQPGTRFRLDGLGLPGGHQFVVIDLEVPTIQGESQRAELVRIARESGIQL